MTGRLGWVWPWLLIGVAVVSVTVTAWQEVRVRDQAQCQARYNTQFAATITARGRLADESTAALNRMVTAVQTAKSRQDVAAALTAFTTANAVIAGERRAKSFPSIAALSRC
jgi:hypothetical protein